MVLHKHKLGELLDVKRGASLAGEYYATSGDYIRLTCGNFDYQNNSFKLNTSKDNLFYTGPVRKEFIMKKGDIITPLTEQAIGLLGSTAIIPEDDKYIQSQDVAKIICKENLLYPMFAYYLISSDIVKKQFYEAAENNFKAAMKYISEHQLQSQFQKRIDIILHNCESSGWGFPDSMWDIYYDYSDREEE